jgi:hypothetical protein
MSIRMHRRDEERLELSHGDFLIVKQDLNAGEYRAFLRAATKPLMMGATGAPASMELDPIAAGEALVLAYLLDWSFQDADGRPLVIREQPPAVVRAVLNNIDHAAYMEVQRAIQAHQTARETAIEDEKKTRSGAIEPARTLTSVAS